MVVSPYHSGEVIVQNYNAVLTLGHLATASDAVLVLENEHVSPHLQAQPGSMRQAKVMLADGMLLACRSIVYARSYSM